MFVDFIKITSQQHLFKSFSLHRSHTYRDEYSWHTEDYYTSIKKSDVLFIEMAKEYSCRLP